MKSNFNIFRLGSKTIVYNNIIIQDWLLIGINRRWCFFKDHLSQRLMENTRQIEQKGLDKAQVPTVRPTLSAGKLLKGTLFTFNTTKCFYLTITHQLDAAAAGGIAGKGCNCDRNSHHQRLKHGQDS